MANDDVAGDASRTAARIALLHELTLAVTTAGDATAAAKTIVGLGRRLLDAVSSLLWLVAADDALELAASDGVPEAFLSRFQRLVPSDDLPATHALAQGRELWVSTLEEYVALVPSVAETARAMNRPTSFAALPVVFEKRKLGVIVFGFPSPHSFRDDDRTVARSIASHAAQTLERARLQSAQARALANTRVIARVGAMLASSLDVDATLRTLAQAVVPDVADWCAVDLFTDGNVRRLTAHHSDPSKVAVAVAYAERYPTRLDDASSSVARIIATGEPVWAPRITPEMLAGSIKDPEQLAVLLSLGLRSTVQAPLVSEGEVRGVVTFIMSESGREYDADDRDVLVDIGRRAGDALTNASLYARARRARDRVTRLATVTAALAVASTSADVGDVACREGAAALGAGGSALYEVDGDVLRLRAERNLAPGLTQRFGEIPLDADLPVARVAARNKAIVIESGTQLAREFPAMGPRDHGYALVCEPLADRSGKVVGALAFAFDTSRTFSSEDREFARTLADHCAHAFERGRLLDRERIVAERLALLAAAGEALSATIEYEPTLQTVVQIALPTLGDFGFFDVIEEGGDVRRVSAAHDDDVVAGILAQSRWVRSERTDINLCALSSGTSALHSDIDDVFLRDMATSEGHLEVLRKLRLCSMVTVPVTLRGELLGALTVCFGRSQRHHTREDLDLARELARRGAVAVEQARLYRASLEATRRAEEANRLKDDFLATVSHELRTPLNAMLGWAHILEGGRAQDGAFVQRGIEIIRRNADAQRKIIDDLLDVSRIVTGKLHLDVAPVDLGVVVRDALDALRPAAEAKGIRFATEEVGSGVTVVGDAARLQQVAWNLLSNAVKFSGEGGTVHLSLRAAPDGIHLLVRDDGEGIAPEFLPFVFDRFRQGDSSSTRQHGGLGLGLAVVRHLVELHGGTVVAASEGRLRGATFEVVLPPPRPASRPDGAAERPSTRPSGELAGARILVVEGDDDSREVLELILSQAGAEVIAVATSDEAISVAERQNVDLLVSEMSTADVDGFALLGVVRELTRARGRPFRAIAVTAHGRAEDRAAARGAGFLAHVMKPINAALLVAAARDAIGSE